MREKRLENLLGADNILTDAILPETITQRTYSYSYSPYETPQAGDIQHVKIIDFKDLTSPSALRGYGFDSTCATCSRHYSLIFVDGTGIERAEEGRDVFLKVGVSDEMTVTAFVNYLYNAIKDSSYFIDHYTQYALDGTKLYVYDFRGDYESDRMDFETAAYLKPKNAVIEYIGPDVYVGYSYKKEDIKVTVEWTNGEVDTLEQDEFDVNSTQTKFVGSNRFYAIVDNVQYPFYIKALSNLQSIQGSYFGPELVSGEVIDPDRITAIVKYITHGEIQLNSGEFEIIDQEVIYGKNTVDIKYSDQYETVYGEVTIPVKPKYIRLMAWYEDFPIQTVGEYNPEKVVIYLFPEVGDWIRVPYTYPGISINSIRVDKEGETWYTVTYKPTGKDEDELSDIYPVVGFVKKEFIDLDFLVVYINKETREETDYTEFFKDMFTLDDELRIGWNGFLRVVNDLQVYGMYRMIAPKASGLDNRFDTEWHVFCPHERALKATITKIFRDQKEVQENGEEHD